MKFFKIILVIFALLLVIALTGTIGIYTYLQTQGGQTRLTEMVAGITEKTGQLVVLQGVKGNIFYDFTINQIRIVDEKGVWLTIDEMQLVWRPLQLLRKEQGVTLVAAKTFTLHRQPVLKEQPDKPKSQGNAFSIDAYTQYFPKKIQLDAIIIEPPITGSEHRLSLSAGGNAELYTADLVTLAGPETTLNAKANFVPGKTSLKLAFNENAGGLAGTLLKLPEDATMYAEIDVRTLTDGMIHIDKAIFSAASMELAATGGIHPGQQTIQVNLHLNMPDISPLQSLANTTLHGHIQALVDVTGNYKNLDVTMQTASTSLFAAGTQVNSLILGGSATLNPQEWQKPGFKAAFALLGKALVNEQESRVNLAGMMRGSELTLDPLEAIHGVYEAKGQGSFNLETHALAATIQTNDMPLQQMMPTSKLTGTLTAKAEVDGNLEAMAITAQANMDTPQGKSVLNFSGDAENGFKQFTGVLEGELNHAKHHFEIVTEIETSPEQIQLNKLALNGPGMDVKGEGSWIIASKLADADIRINVTDLRPSGQLLGMDISGALKSTVDLSSETGVQTGVIALDQLSVSYMGKDIRLVRPSSLRLNDDTGVLSPFHLSIAGGTVVMQGQMTRETIKGKMTARNINLEHFVDSALAQGTANATLDISGRTASPAIDIQASSSAQSGNYPVELDVKGKWRGRNIQLDARMASRKARATVNAKVDGTLSLLPFSTTLSKQSPLNGNLAANIPLDILNTTLWQKGQRIGGLLSGNARLQGTLGEPQFLGRFTLKDGEYAHPASGVCIRGADAVITGSSTEISLEHLRAASGDGGSLVARAKLDMHGVKPLNGSVVMRDFQLFCGGLATGDIAGNLRVTGTLQSMLLAGNLDLGPLNVQLPGNARGARDIPQIETIRVKPGSSTRENKVASVAKLNITLDAPGQIFVRGRGLDAEFEGNLAISGTASDPVLAGQFRARRGSFSLLDRVLQLETGEIRFSGPIPPAPFLNIIARTRAQNTEFEIGLTGPVQKPELTMSSNPSLPRDELLALLLFGRELQAISAFEALQLAQATRELAGLGSGEPGILDKARSTLGLDTLNVSTDEENNVSVTTGKYVTDRVFVGVRQGATPEAREITTQIELSPSISANTTLDGEGNQGVGMNWRYDY